jgi:hypothetical protein
MTAVSIARSRASASAKCWRSGSSGLTHEVLLDLRLLADQLGPGSDLPARVVVGQMRLLGNVGRCWTPAAAIAIDVKPAISLLSTRCRSQASSVRRSALHDRRATLLLGCGRPGRGLQSHQMPAMPVRCAARGRHRKRRRRVPDSSSSRPGHRPVASCAVIVPANLVRCTENPLASAGLHLLCLSGEVILLAALPAESFPKMPVADETKATAAEITALHAILMPLARLKDPSIAAPRCRRILLARMGRS